MSDPPVIECPNCGAINPGAARFCSTCEADLRAGQPEEQPVRLADAEAAALEKHIAPIEGEKESPAAKDEPAEVHEPAGDDMVEEGDVAPEPEPEEEEASADNIDADDDQGDVGETGSEVVDTSGWGTQARKMLLEQVDQQRLTIGVIGNFDVGKTFFISQLAEVAKSKGYTHEKVMIDPNTLLSVAQTTFGATSRDLRESETLPATLNVWVHDFIISEEEDCFRLVDIPGEFFGAALGDRSVHQTDNGRVAMLYPALGISDAIILVVPSHHVFPTVDIKARRSVELLGDIRRVSNLLEAMKAERDGDFGAAVEEVLGWDPVTRRARLAQHSQGLSKKPIMALFSQADRCFGIGPAREPRGMGMDLPERDPLLCAARQLPTLVNQLHRGFEDFRIDFLTAAEGQPPESKEFHVGTPCIGVWSPVEWLRQRVALHQAAEPARGRLSQLLHRILMTDRLRADERNSGWAIDLRKKADREFRSALAR